MTIGAALGAQTHARLFEGAHAMDVHFREAPFESNLPVALALVGLWNASALGYRQRDVVPYATDEAAGTIVVNTEAKFLYLVLGGGKAMRYGIGTAKDGFEWSGTHHITNKREWPDWTPPAEMIARRPDIPHYMPGGVNNPLGPRALYIGSTLYRIHGTTEPWTIGHNVSSGCIRLVNEDIIDLYSRVKIGAKVIVL